MNGAHHTHGGASPLPALLLLAALLAVYLAAVVAQRRAGRSWSPWRSASWAAGLALLAAAFAPPLADLAHHDLRAHMAQHLLVGMLAPLGLALAAPVTLALRTLKAPAARRVVALLRSRPLHLLGHPVTALALNIGGMYVLYLTPLFALSLHSPVLHLAVMAHFLAAGYLFTWSIAGADRAGRRASWNTRLAVLFVAIATHGMLAKLMYARGLPASTGASLAELQAAAQLMFYGGDLADLLLAACLFAERAGRRAPATRYPADSKTTG